MCKCLLRHVATAANVTSLYIEQKDLEFLKVGQVNVVVPEVNNIPYQSSLYLSRIATLMCDFSDTVFVVANSPFANIFALFCYGCAFYVMDCALCTPLTQKKCTKYLQGALAGQKLHFKWNNRFYESTVSATYICTPTSSGTHACTVRKSPIRVLLCVDT